jgi:drug/metabolite transporter (DMT)-like permease
LVITSIPTPVEVPGAGRGILFALSSMFAFAILDAAVKLLLNQGFPTIELVFFRGFFGLIPLMAVVARQGSWAQLKTKRPFAHLGRSVCGVLSVTLFFYAFRTMKYADVVALSFSAPIFVTALSVPFLGEKVGPRRWAAVAVGFIGVLLMVQPGPDMLAHPMSLVVLLSAVLYAFAILQIRALGSSEPSVTIVFYFTVFVVLTTGALLPFNFKAPEDWGQMALLLLVGLSGGSAQMLMTQAYRHAPAAVIASFDYSIMVWAVALGYLLFDELPGWDIVIGAVVVAASGMYIAYRETRRRSQTA